MAVTREKSSMPLGDIHLTGLQEYINKKPVKLSLAKISPAWVGIGAGYYPNSSLDGAVQ